jgi:hypothetical protein
MQTVYSRAQSPITRLCQSTRLGHYGGSDGPISTHIWNHTRQVVLAVVALGCKVFLVDLFGHAFAPHKANPPTAPHRGGQLRVAGEAEQCIANQVGPELPPVAHVNGRDGSSAQVLPRRADGYPHED